MNADQERFLREWSATLDRAVGDLRGEADALLLKSDRLAEDVLLSDANIAYRKIERAADRIMEKRDMSREEAVALALKRKPELYVEYERALSKAQQDGGLIGHADNLANARSLVEWAQHRIAEAADPTAMRHELVSNPELVSAARAVQADAERRARAEKVAAAPKVQKAAPVVRQEPRFGVPRRELVEKNAQPVRVSDHDSDRELADIMDEPAPGEGRLVDSARADGASETVAKAVALVARVANGVRDDLSRETLIELRKAVTGE